MVYMEIPPKKAVLWESIISLSNRMVFQANNTGYLCSVSKYVELHVDNGFLRFS